MCGNASIDPMTQFVDGKKIADDILKVLALRLRSGQKFQPKLVVIFVGENRASASYVKMKQRRGEEIGVAVDVRNFPNTITQEDLITQVKNANSESDVRGIIVQLPLPKHIDRDLVLDSVDPRLDVDCLTSENKKRLIDGKALFVPPAAAAVIKILEYYNVHLEGKNILIVGSGDLIGKPLAAILLSKQIAFELANSQTENLSELVTKADIIITGVGKAGLISGSMIKDGAIIIDAGTTGSDEGEIVGDADQESVMGKASLLAPVPGGVGPVTVAMLLQNVVRLA